MPVVGRGNRKSFKFHDQGKFEQVAQRIRAKVGWSQFSIFVEWSLYVLNSDWVNIRGSPQEVKGMKC